MDTGRERLAKVMNDRRRQLRMRWTVVASRAGMSPQNLLRIRNGDINLTWEAIDGIEDALAWQRGSVEAILDGGDPTPIASKVAEEQPDLRDDIERQLWALTDLTERERWAYIRLHRQMKGAATGD